MAKEARKIKQAQIKLQRELKSFVTVMGVEAKNHFLRSFRNQGFTDNTLKKWKPRRTERRRTRGGRIADDTGRAILVQSGDLRKSIKVKKKSFNSVTLGSDLPYAQIHNDGLRGRAWGKYPFKMPKRQFMGDSQKLTKKLRNILKRKVNKAFR